MTEFLVSQGPASTPIRIGLVDDQEIARRGMRRVLEAREGWNIVGEATMGREAVTLAEELKPDVMIVDVSARGPGAYEVVRRIVESAPRTEVLVVAMEESEELVQGVLEAGARGFLLKSDASLQIVAAVDALSVHKPFLTSKMKEVVLKGYLSGKTLKVEGLGRRLTPRESEIVRLLAEGRTSREVAAALGISVKTAETHRTNIMRKLDLHSISELVRYALRNHIIEA